MTLLTILLQQQGQGAGWSSIIMMVALVAIFYFFMIRPQTKRQKEIRKFREALSVRDKVVTAGGRLRKSKIILSFLRLRIMYGFVLINLLFMLLLPIRRLQTKLNRPAFL